MAAGTSPIFVDTPSNGTPQTFVNADGTTVKTIYTAGADGARIDAVTVCSDDTAAVNLAFSIDIGGTNYYIGNVNVPIGSGYTTVALVDAIATLCPNLGYLALAGGAKLECNAVVAVTAAKTVTVTPVVAGDY